MSGEDLLAQPDARPADGAIGPRDQAQALGPLGPAEAAAGGGRRRLGSGGRRRDSRSPAREQAGGAAGARVADRHAWPDDERARRAAAKARPRAARPTDPEVVPHPPDD